MEAKFKKGDTVKFERNKSVKVKKTTIIDVVPPVSYYEKQVNTSPVSYIIEYNDGWSPNTLRQQQFGLDANKKYLFVAEDELTSV